MTLLFPFYTFCTLSTLPLSPFSILLSFLFLYHFLLPFFIKSVQSLSILLLLYSSVILSIYCLYSLLPSLYLFLLFPLHFLFSHFPYTLVFLGFLYTFFFFSNTCSLLSKHFPFLFYTTALSLPPLSPFYTFFRLSQYSLFFFLHTFFFSFFILLSSPFFILFSSSFSIFISSFLYFFLFIFDTFFSFSISLYHSSILLPIFCSYSFLFISLYPLLYTIITSFSNHFLHFLCYFPPLFYSVICSFLDSLCTLPYNYLLLFPRYIFYANFLSHFYAIICLFLYTTFPTLSHFPHNFYFFFYVTFLSTFYSITCFFYVFLFHFPFLPPFNTQLLSFFSISLLFSCSITTCSYILLFSLYSFLFTSSIQSLSPFLCYFLLLLSKKKPERFYI